MMPRCAGQLGETCRQTRQRPDAGCQNLAVGSPCLRANGDDQFGKREFFCSRHIVSDQKMGSGRARILASPPTLAA
jgi:hypothetical protein